MSCPVCQKEFHENAAYMHHVDNFCGKLNNKDESSGIAEQKKNFLCGENKESNSNKIERENTGRELRDRFENTLRSKNPEVERDVYDSPSAEEQMSEEAFKDKFLQYCPNKKLKYECAECHKGFEKLYKLKRHAYPGKASGMYSIVLKRYLFERALQFYEHFALKLWAICLIE